MDDGLLSFSDLILWQVLWICNEIRGSKNSPLGWKCCLRHFLRWRREFSSDLRDGELSSKKLWHQGKGESTGEPATATTAALSLLTRTESVDFGNNCSHKSRTKRQKEAGGWNSSTSCFVAEEMSTPENESVRHPWKFIAREEMQRLVAQRLQLLYHDYRPKGKGHATLTDRWPINYCKRTDSCSLRDEERSYNDSCLSYRFQLVRPYHIRQYALPSN